MIKQGSVPWQPHDDWSGSGSGYMSDSPILLTVASPTTGQGWGTLSPPQYSCQSKKVHTTRLWTEAGQNSERPFPSTEKHVSQGNLTPLVVDNDPVACLLSLNTSLPTGPITPSLNDALEGVLNSKLSYALGKYVCQYTSQTKTLFVTMSPKRIPWVEIIDREKGHILFLEMAVMLVNHRSILLLMEVPV